MKNIYKKAVELLPASHIDHHESDLYLRATRSAKALIDSYDFRRNVTSFISPIDNARWFDVPFAYTPYWEEKAMRNNSRLDRHEEEH